MRKCDHPFLEKIKIKRRYLIITIVIIAIFVSIFIYWYEVPMLSLSVETDKEYYTSSENITITIILRNNGLQERCVAELGVEMGSISIIFHTPNNETFIYEGPMVMCLPASMKLNALGEYRYTYTLNNTTKHYWGNFTEIGRYEVIVKYISKYFTGCSQSPHRWEGELYAKTYFYITKE